MRIRSQLLMLVVAALVPLVLLAAVLTAQLWRVQREAFDARNLERVAAMRIALDVELESYERVLRSLAASDNFLPSGNMQVAAERFDRLLAANPVWHTLGVAGPDGRPLLVRTARDEPPALLDGVTREAVLRRRDLVVSDLIDYDESRQLATFVAEPVLRDGTLRGVIYLAIDDRGWLSLLERMPLARSWTLTLNDSGSRVIARTLRHDEFAGRTSNPDYWKQTLGRSEGVIANEGLGGQRWYSAFARLQSAGWMIGTGVPQSEVQAAVRWSANAMAAAIVAAVVIGFLLALLIGRRITGATDRLAAFARSLGTAQGDVPTTPLPIAEAETVRRAMADASVQLRAHAQALTQAAESANQSARDLQQALSAADEAHRALQLALSSIDDQFIVLDRDFHYVLVNQRVLEMTGRTEAELIGRSIFELFPDTRGTVFESEVRLAAQQRQPRRFEMHYGPKARIFENAVFPTAEGGLALVVSDVTERKRAEQALVDADRRKDEFLATLAHELRNPLAPISNAVQLLRAVEGLDPTLAWVRELIDRQVTHLTRLIDDLMDVARIARNRLELRREPLLLSDIIDNAVEACRPLIQERRHELKVTQTDPLVTVDADSVRLTQVFSNLINNAAKYTPEGGSIDVVVERSPGPASEVAIHVIDNGIGIPPKKLPLIFDLFFQIDGTLERSGGLGIGLSLVRQLVSLHGGRISVHSAGLGCGSRFTVTLPRLTGAGAPPATRGPGTAVEVGDGARARVVIVDDNRDAAETLAAVMRSHGLEAAVAFDGWQGHALIEALQPAVAIVDLSMPKLNGYQLCRLVRSWPAGLQPRLIALSGFGQPADRERSLEAGFDEHLVKPVDAAQLVQLIRGIVAVGPAPARSLGAVGP